MMYQHNCGRVPCQDSRWITLQEVLFNLQEV